MVIKAKAEKVIKELGGRVTVESFEKKMFRRNSDSDNVFYYYQNYIEKLLRDGQAGTASSYSSSLKSLKSFIHATKRRFASVLPFATVTIDFLNQYESWMNSEGKEKTTVGIYLRPLRALFNIAIAEGDIEAEVYPFGKRKYQIPGGRNIKKSLNKAGLSALYKYPVEANSHLEKARDFWFFSYQCNGINFRDIAELKFKNVSVDTITFVRNKTKNTTRAHTKPIIISITPYVSIILNKYSNPSGLPDDYVFPIFHTGMDPVQKLKANQNFIRFVNQHIKKVARLAGLPEDISTYSARHSYTTVAIRNGATMEYIQESLGHQSMSTTQNYWGGFEESVKTEIANKLMDF